MEMFEGRKVTVSFEKSHVVSDFDLQELVSVLANAFMKQKENEKGPAATGPKENKFSY